MCCTIRQCNPQKLDMRVKDLLHIFTERRYLLPRRFVLLIGVVLGFISCHSRSLASNLLSNVAWLQQFRGLEESIVKTDFIPAAVNWQMIPSATRVFLAAVELDPSNASAITGLAFTAAAEGDLKTAVSEMQRSVYHKPTTVRLFVLGNLMHTTGNDHIALRYWRLAEASPYFYRVAERFELSGDMEKALELYQRVVQINPEDEEAFLKMGQIYFGKGDYLAAKDAFVANVTLHPNRAGYAWLGRCLEANGELEEAIQAYASAAELGELWYGYLAVGDLHMRLGNYMQAEESYLSARERFPGVLLVDLRLGDLALDLEQYDRAWFYIQSAQQRNPDHPLVTYAVGRWYYRKGDYKLASEQLEQALEHGLQADFWFYKMLADSYFRTDRYCQAIDCYLTALRFTERLSKEHAFICGRVEQLSDGCPIRALMIEDSCE